MEQTKRQKIHSRATELKNDRVGNGWDAHWKDISDYLLPRSGRFITTDRNKGDKRHNNIYDSTGTRALRILAAGMMAGMTSPARPWFRLTTSVPELDESDAVKAWLADSTRLMQMIFAKSNIYRVLHSSYEELGAFGTASGIILPDYRNVIHGYGLTVGEYSLATDHRGVVNTLYREYEMTVGQMIGEFGKDKCSTTVKSLYDQNKLSAPVTVIQGIEPRAVRDATKRDAKNMAYQSIYLERGGNEDDFLRESGFKEFPGLCPRWMTSGGDIYGNSPAMEALGDIKQLQHEQLRKAQGIDYQTNPPIQAPVGLENQVNRLPGGVTYVNPAAPNGGIKNAFEVNLNLSYLLQDIQDVRERINGAFYADLFLMLANNTNTTMTATEVAERHEEKLLMLGPVLERMHNEILDPLIEMTFARMVEANIVPPPPQELQGMELNVEFVSMLAQAQRAIATNGVDRFVGNLGAVAQFKPGVLDKFDEDRWADAYADMLGIDPELIVPGDKVALIRKARAEAQLRDEQNAQMNVAADTAQKLGSVDTSKQSALTDVTRAFSGYT